MIPNQENFFLFPYSDYLTLVSHLYTRFREMDNFSQD